ncbi:hypothetical protein [Acaryochloris marina]|uniref:Uncharacterized protein n=1 Tax=Acaryochloris marina (strain MBIC 11017) TaxID=329726 RepID=B0BZT7_ACAM1|nr:hypothetical protein [Acaryochloris marina]ABW27147.1 hypothetical protein AM1_2132 [Acaryochloris marina MBIC11017]
MDSCRYSSSEYACLLGFTTGAGTETAIAVSQTYNKVISIFAELGMVTL